LHLNDTLDPDPWLIKFPLLFTADQYESKAADPAFWEYVCI